MAAVYHQGVHHLLRCDFCTKLKPYLAEVALQAHVGKIGIPNRIIALLVQRLLERYPVENGNSAEVCQKERSRGKNKDRVASTGFTSLLVSQ